MDNVDPVPAVTSDDEKLNIAHKSSKANHFFFGNHAGEVDYETFLSHGIGENDNNNNENGRQFKHNPNESQQKHVYRKDGFLWIILPYVLMGIVACFVVILHDGNDGVVYPQSSLLAHSSSRKHKTRKRVGRFWLLETEKEPNNNNTTVTARYNGPDPKEMSKEQQEIRDYILDSRPRTGLSGPFGPWLSVPSIAKPASELGKACRYDTSLSKRESELVILLTGAKHQSRTELTIHTKEAINAAGMDPSIPQTIWKHLLGDAFSKKALQKHVLPLLETDRERAIAMFCGELLETSGVVSDETYQSTKLALGNQDSALVEITSIVGYYTYVSYTLNVFRIPP